MLKTIVQAFSSQNLLALMYSTGMRRYFAVPCMWSVLWSLGCLK
ncbi:hypothetical protein [Legionella jordanis]|nr:hypothetical protein [Legionella jordanis]VEH11817.1 Uncharacterised protein [Legionella jordanis]